MTKISHLNLPARHFIVSTVSAIIECSIFYFMYINLKIALSFSHFTAFFFASISGFILHSFFTFAVGYLRIRNALFFLVQVSIVLVIGFYLLKFLISWGLNPLISKVFQLCLTFLLNILLGKFLSFKK